MSKPTGAKRTTLEQAMELLREYRKTTRRDIRPRLSDETEALLKAYDEPQERSERPKPEAPAVKRIVRFAPVEPLELEERIKERGIGDCDKHELRYLVCGLFNKQRELIDAHNAVIERTEAGR